MYNSKQGSKSRNSVDLKGGLTPTLSRKPDRLVRECSSVRDEVSKTSGRYRDIPGHSAHMTHSPASQLPQWDKTPGVKGIQNHGNTCFMNTILQSLSNTDVFSDYFVQRKYKDVCQTKGLKRIVGNIKGEVSEQLGCLLEGLWSGVYTSELSSNFKSAVSKYNSQYKGSAQHDAQEFLLWLLDRINEELYQGKKKAKDGLSKSKKDKSEDTVQSSSPETVLASATGFDIYNKFQALYQSSLKCPNCCKQSNTYESYLCLSLPVPQKSTRPVFITVVYLDDDPKQLKIALEMNVLDTVKDLREKLAEELHVIPKRLVLCQVCDDGFRNTFGDSQPLTDIHEAETIYVFETFPFSEINKTPDSDLIQILIVHVEKFTASKKSFRFCSPEVIKVLRDIDFPTLQRLILKSMDRLAISDDIVEESARFSRAIFDIRVVDSGATDSYLLTDVDMPLYTEAIDRALTVYDEDYGPAHVKFVIEWDPQMKARYVDHDDDLVDEHDSVHKARLNQQQPSQVTLHDCLKLFTNQERLGAGDAWHCPHCEKSEEGAIKQLRLWSTPDILVIHLKRFTHYGSKRNKVNVLVNFPVSGLDMMTHVMPGQTGNHGNQSDLYDLYAVSNHYGTMSGGHYTAFCRNPVDMCWYEYDDTHVKPLQQRDVITRAAYLLFYQRRKLTNQSIDSLHAHTHWVYTVCEPQKPLTHHDSSPVWEEKTVDSSHEGRVGTRQYDYQDLYVNKVNLVNTEDKKSKSVGHSRAKSEIHDRRDYSERHKAPESLDLAREEEERLLEELRRGINSPKMEHRDFNRESPRTREINSPRTENREINYSRQESHRKEISTQDHCVTDSSPSGRGKPSVAERISQSRAAGHKDAEWGRGTVTDRYRRSDSMESGRNNQSFTSGSDSSSPPSPQDLASAALASHAARQANLLNNEREPSIVNGNVAANNVKLKIHSNQIGKPSRSSSKSRTDQSKTSDIHNTKSTNQKVNNASTGPVRTVRRDVYGTPQQVRKSPSPPGPVWSTPQPTRRHTSENGRPVIMDRQFSVPPRASKPAPPSTDITEEPDLHVQGQGYSNEQPRSLPVEQRKVADKPPLPSKPRQVRPTSSGGNVYDSRVATARHTPDRTEPESLTNGRPLSAYEPREDNTSTDRSQVEVSSRESRSRESRRSQGHRSEVRMRNSSADRTTESRHNVRARSERPKSYHQASHALYDDYSPRDDYYLPQPVEEDLSPRFERGSHYATVRQPRSDSYYTPKLERRTDYHNDIQYLTHHLQDKVYMSNVNAHPARSRAPVSYNPSLYEDRSLDLPRYQPHLHFGRAMAHLANRERHKTHTQYLTKESSV